MCVKFSLGDLNLSLYLALISTHTYKVTITPRVCDDKYYIYIYIYIIFEP